MTETYRPGLLDAKGLLADVPWGEQAGRKGDAAQLEFDSRATVLANAAVHTPDTLTIGVYGDWGTGKSSFMRLMKSHVDAEETAVGVWFNAWQYEREEHLIVPLVATIVKAVDKALKDKKLKKVKKGAEKLRDALRGVIYGISVKGKVGMPMLGEAELSLSPKDMIERYQALTKEVMVERTLYYDAFEQLREIADSENGQSKTPRIVVFVDDLDRCSPDKAIDVLESIKLVLCQPGFSFILGIAHNVVRGFIRHKY